MLASLRLRAGLPRKALAVMTYSPRMQRRHAWIGWAARAFAPSLLLVLFGICTGVGLQRIWHLTKAQESLAHDAGCTKELRVTTPASDSAGCRIVHGTIVRSYETEHGSQYGGGIAYDQYLVFAPQNGEPTVTLRTGRTYSSIHRQPGGPAAAEYVDGEIDYVASAFATLGPIFDPETDKDSDWLLIGLGAFFAVIAAVTAAGIAFANKAAKR